MPTVRVSTHLLRRAAPFITAAALLFPAVAPAAGSSVQGPAAPLTAQAQAKAAKAKAAKAKRAKARAAKRARLRKARAAAARHRAMARSLISSDDLWATVNICDTRAHPNSIGIRASMPGTHQPGQMSMRFRVQYYISANDSWQYVQGGADSHWVPLGASTSATRQSGYTFAFLPPLTGAYALRGVVDYQWRVGGRVSYTAQASTHSGHSDAALGDPAGWSSGLCTITK